MNQNFIAKDKSFGFHRSEVVSWSFISSEAIVISGEQRRTRHFIPSNETDRFKAWIEYWFSS
jgi:hypothetical protein